MNKFNKLELGSTLIKTGIYNFICENIKNNKSKICFLDINNLKYPNSYFDDGSSFKKYLSISPHNRYLQLPGLEGSNSFKFIPKVVCSEEEEGVDQFDIKNLCDSYIKPRFFLKSEVIKAEKINVDEVITLLKNNNFEPLHMLRVYSPYIAYEILKKFPNVFNNLLFCEINEFVNSFNGESSFIEIIKLLEKNGYSILDLNIKRAQRHYLPSMNTEDRDSIIIGNKKYTLDGRFGQPALGNLSFFKDPLKNKDYLDRIKHNPEEFFLLAYVLYSHGQKDTLSEIIENTFTESKEYRRLLLDAIVDEEMSLYVEENCKHLPFNEGRELFRDIRKTMLSESQEKKPSSFIQPLCEFKKKEILESESEILLSIHIQSNNPKNLIEFFENLQLTAVDYTCFEVCVKVDEGDVATCSTIAAEVKKRPFTIKYIKTQPPKKFPDLWESMNDLFIISNSKSYFYLNLNDEMFFMNIGWDRDIEKFKDLYPDKIYRLRTSRFRNFRYFDLWACGYSPETSALTTRKWLEIGGGWCPCLGPDTFQQCVSYYLSKKNLHSQSQLLRDVVVNEIKFGGEVAMAGIKPYLFRKRLAEATEAWFILFSHKMQTEASRRASKLECHIYAHEYGLTDLSIRDNKSKKRIEILNAKGIPVYKSTYKISRFSMSISNFMRKFNFSYYGGGGPQAKSNMIKGLLQYYCFSSVKFNEFYNYITSIDIIRSLAAKILKYFPFLRSKIRRIT